MSNEPRKDKRVQFIVLDVLPKQVLLDVYALFDRNKIRVWSDLLDLTDVAQIMNHELPAVQTNGKQRIPQKEMTIHVSK